MPSFLMDKRVLAAIGGILLVVVLAIAINGYFNYRNKQNIRHEEQLTKSGEVKERAEAQAEVINRVEKANDIERNPDPVLTNSVRCKYDRSANCK